MAPKIINPKALGYVRVSSKAQVFNTSPDNQIDQLRAYAQLKNYTDFEVIQEMPFSASKRLEDRPGGKLAWEMIKRKEVGAFIVTTLDRAFRDAEDCLRCVRLWKDYGTTEDFKFHPSLSNVERHNYGIKIFLTAKDILHKNLQSGKQFNKDIFNIWIVLPIIYNLHPKIYDTHTYLIIDRNYCFDLYFELVNEILNNNVRYAWILSTNNYYSERSVINSPSYSTLIPSPFRNFWYSYDDE